MQTLAQPPFRKDREDLEQLIRRAAGENVIRRVEEKWFDRWVQWKASVNGARMTYEFERVAESHRCIHGLGGSHACITPAQFRVGTSVNWRRRAYGGGILFHTCADHLPAGARSRDGALPAGSCELAVPATSAEHAVSGSELSSTGQ